MKLVREHINFKRGQSPHKSLSIGEHRPFEIGDIIELNVDIFWNGVEWKEPYAATHEPGIIAGTQYTIRQITDNNHYELVYVAAGTSSFWKSFYIKKYFKRV